MRVLGTLITLHSALCVLLFFSTLPAQAHKLQMFVTIEALSPHSETTTSPAPRFQLRGQVYFSAQVPLTGGQVEILSLEDDLLDIIRTDKNGRFNWVLKNTKPFKVQCQSIDGHLIERIITPKISNQKTARFEAKDVRTIDGVKKETSVGAALKAEELRHIISLELTPLKEQISKLHHKIWLLEILAGLGLLFGGFGIWMFVLAKRTTSTRGEV